MAKPTSPSNKRRKQHTPEFRDETLKLAEHIDIAAAARKLTAEVLVLNGSWLSGMKSWPFSKMPRHTENRDIRCIQRGSRAFLSE
jgi:transposase